MRARPIGDARVADWPRLAVVEHLVSEEEMRDRCARTVPVARDHELKHCDGYDHSGSSALRGDLERWRAEKRSLSVSPLK